MSTKIIREFVKPDGTGKKRTNIEYHCDHCKKLHVKLKINLREKYNFCSASCFGKFKRALNPMVKLICAVCDKEFERKPTSLRNSRSGIYFCSRECKCKGQSIKGGIKEIQPDHYGTSEHYRTLAFKELSNECYVCGYSKYPDVLEVHHKDFNRENNELSNLEILCPTHHVERHFLTKSGKYACKKVKFGRGGGT